MMEEQCLPITYGNASVHAMSLPAATPFDGRLYLSAIPEIA